MTVIRTEPLYLGRQFTSIDANAGINTSGRVIIYDNFPKFHVRAWDNAGDGGDIWFEFILYTRQLHIGIPPPLFNYANLFNVNSRNNSSIFYDRQYYKSGEVCTVNFAIDSNPLHDLSVLGFTIYALQWIAYDRISDTPLASNVIEFTYLPETRLCRLENLDFISFDRVTIFRPRIGTGFWEEAQFPGIPMSANLREPFESAAKTLSLQFADPDGLFLPQSEDRINYINGWMYPLPGLYSPVFRLGNRVAYEHSIAYGTIAFGVTNLITYTPANQSRYRFRVWTLPAPNQREPLVKQAVEVEYWDGAAWVLAQEGNEYNIFQHCVFFQEVQTAVRASGLRYQCHWDYCGMFYMAAPTYNNAPTNSNIISVDCQDRLSKIDSNGRVYLATADILREAIFEVHREESIAAGGAPIVYYWNDTHLKTWQDPDSPGSLLLWFYSKTSYIGNYAGTDPIADNSARIWNDDFEIFVEYWDAVWGVWHQLDEDAYERTIYGLLINKDWSADLPWQNQHLRITFQTIVPDTNPVNEILQAILEYPNYEEATKEYGGANLSSDDYSIPGLGSDSADDWMEQDINRFVWTHYMGSAFDAVKECMRIAGFPFNYRVTSEPNPSWLVTPFDANAQDIITFREVSQYPMENVEMMIMLPIQVQQKIEEDRMATIVRSRVFDDFCPNLAVEKEMITTILWGPGNSAGLNLPYEGGFQHHNTHPPPGIPGGPSMGPTSDMLEVRREKGEFYTALPPEVVNTGGITNSWRPGMANNNARGVVTDGDVFTHLRWLTDSKDWGDWPDFIATPMLEVAVPFTKDGIDLAAIDLRNGEWHDITSPTEWATAQHIGIKYGLRGDRISANGVTIFPGDPNVITGLPIGGYWPNNELGRNGATIEIVNSPDPNDIGNTYPIISNDDAAGTCVVAIQDPWFIPPVNTLHGQLGGGILPIDCNIRIRNYKWLPDFNRKLHAPQETISWELSGYTIPGVYYLEIWCIKPGATSIRTIGTSSDNDQYFDIGSIFVYDGSATIGRPVFMRVRDNIVEVPNESVDIIDDNNEFFREDLVERLGMRTQVIPDDKALADFDMAFERSGQGLYENLVIEDSYEINGVYYPYFPRFSTVLINIESMRIAFPALLESRDFTFAGVQRSYKLTLRNYNNTIWPHPYEPDSYESDFVFGFPEIPG